MVVYNKVNNRLKVSIVKEEEENSAAIETSLLQL